MRDLVRKNLRFFLLFLLAALTLRLLFVFFAPGVVTDSFIYGDIAKNWLRHGVYGLTGTDDISPTYIRLPGYPAFLAAVWAACGLEHYRAVLFVQVFFDLGTCFLCAEIALRLIGSKAAKAAFALACLCPFLANYSAAALTETLEIFFSVLALDLAVRGFKHSASSWEYWIGTGAACGAAILLRPDGAILPAVIVIYLGIKLFDSLRRREPAARPKEYFSAAVILATITILPLVPWTIRNWRVFHQFQPLAPRYANEENEFVPMGFNRWTKTWIADYASVEEVYWSVPGNAIDPEKLPSRTFDNAQQKSETDELINDYNQLLHISPRLDKRFGHLADARIHAHPLRYYVELPVLRILDMWLRPRTEMLPCDSRWWEFNDEPKWSVLAVGLGAINLFYVACALVGWMRSRTLPLTGMLVLFVMLRSAFLGTLENPEPRYTLEMYPVVIVFAGCAFALLRTKS